MCEFCKDIGIGLPNWNFLHDDNLAIIPSGIKIEIRKIVDKTALVFTNSAEEYGSGAINIKFCPMCGRELCHSDNAE